MITPQDALIRLQEGNTRFVSETPRLQHASMGLRRTLSVEGQNPFAVIVGCSDSRVPVELIFDQGFGDLFVIRVAGNIVARSQIASVEFAAERFRTKLVVVLGHSQCGAIYAAIEEILNANKSRSVHQYAIVDRILPAISNLIHEDMTQSINEIVEKAVAANIRSSVRALRHGSEFIEEYIEQGRLHIVGAQYCLETGVVTFFED